MTLIHSPECRNVVSNLAASCVHCGNPLIPRPDSSPESVGLPAATDLAFGTNSAAAGLIGDRIFNPAAMSPALVGLLSLIGGLGQILIGQIAKGVFVLVFCVVLAWVTGGLSLIVTWPIAGVDAYRCTRKLRASQTIGKWQWC